MIPIKVDIVPKSKRPGYAMKPEYITVHQTGNTDKGANAAMHNRYVHNNAPNPSWHYTVDDKEAYQHLPLTENGWHAGDGTNGTGNRKSIAVEICINRDGNLAKAEANAAWLMAKLIKESSTLKPFPACMKQHYDWSKKNCPAQIRGRTNGWANFLKEVEKHLKPVAAPKPDAPSIGIWVNGKDTGLIGYLQNNQTHAIVSEIVHVMGGTITGHGTYVNIVLPAVPTVELERLEKELAKLKIELEASNKIIAAVKKAVA